MMSPSTLSDGAPEEPLGTGHGKQHGHAHRPCRFAKNSDLAGIATKGGDIVPHPLEGGDLVEQASVGVSLTEIKKALGTDPIIDGHTYDAVAGETTAAIPGGCPRSVIFKHAARNPYHHGETG